MIDLKQEHSKQDISLKIDPKEKINTMKVKALKTQFGDAGFVNEGDVFETSEHHAKALIKAGHAEEAKDSAKAIDFKHIDSLHQVTEKVQKEDVKEKVSKSDNPGADKTKK